MNVKKQLIWDIFEETIRDAKNFVFPKFGPTIKWFPISPQDLRALSDVWHENNHHLIGLELDNRIKELDTQTMTSDYNKGSERHDQMDEMISEIILTEKMESLRKLVDKVNKFIASVAINTLIIMILLFLKIFVNNNGLCSL